MLKCSEETSLSEILSNINGSEDEIADKIDNLNLDGVYLVKESQRYYPYDSLAAQVIGSCGIHKINGDSVQNNADEIYDYNIYVGGAMLGRGLTLKGLAITYIIRTSKGVSNVDTVQQRARWFGYKTKYLDLCKIFAVGKIIKEFREIRD